MSGLAVFLDATQLRPKHSLPGHEETQIWARITVSSVLPRLAHDARAQTQSTLGSEEGRGEEGWGGKREGEEFGHSMQGDGPHQSEGRLGCTVRTAVDACGGWAVARSEGATGVQEGQGGTREEGRATFRSR